MKRHWQIRRQFQPTADGARRWDQAYQYLLAWTTHDEPHVVSPPTPLHRPQTEVMHEHSHLCPRVDRTADAGPND
jgi:hypothetical protein